MYPVGTRYVGSRYGYQYVHYRDVGMTMHDHGDPTMWGVKCEHAGSGGSPWLDFVQIFVRSRAAHVSGPVSSRKIPVGVNRSRISPPCLDPALAGNSAGLSDKKVGNATQSLPRPATPVATPRRGCCTTERIQHESRPEPCGQTTSGIAL